MSANLENLISQVKEELVKPPVGGCSSSAKPTDHWEMRTQEQPYAFLSDKKIPEANRYGDKVDLLDRYNHTHPKDRSLFINENPKVGTNPNRNKQHAFFFTADNCIGCHACEAACSEKNNNPAHISFRSVGYVEGGSYPDYKRLNISMACNHCDDPVCLKGCPTRAYTKHAEYGAVLQDPDTCFGCGYCTWVCPYNAPQLDPIQGQVSKCNMCVDRLEVGLKPACVSACVGNALDFGVVENIPENREQAKTQIPGFPDPSITHPNIRFQQKTVLPEEMKRTDSSPVKYHRDASGVYKPVVDQKKGKARHWNLSRLSSRENPLVLFTLLAQMSIGIFAATFLGSQMGITPFVLFSKSSMYVPTLILAFLAVGFGLFMSTTHLGKPMRFYRGFNNLRHSPVCREGAGIAGFMAFSSLHILFSLPSNGVFSGLLLSVAGVDLASLSRVSMLSGAATLFGFLAIVSASVGLYYMYRCYRIKARPFWDHWQTATSFLGNTLALGGFVAGLISVATLGYLQQSTEAAMLAYGFLVLIGIMLEGIGLYAHNRAMNRSEHEGAASHYVQLTTFGKTYFARNIILGVTGVLALALLIFSGESLLFTLPWILVGMLLLASSVMGRALFYVLVIPTTMPGAFFWKNKGFEEHARQIGLANMPQVGVVPNLH